MLSLMKPTQLLPERSDNLGIGYWVLGVGSWVMGIVNRESSVVSCGLISYKVNSLSDNRQI